MDTDKTVLITGSRNASPAMINYVRDIIAYLGKHQWSVVVGDASGVDAAVMEYCRKYDVPCRVFGITWQPRNGKELSFDYTQIPGNFLARDRYMVQQVKRVVAIWDGKSRGTKYTYDYALKQGIKATIHTFLSDS